MQDRVIQTYEGIVHMDFDRKLMEERGYGEYTELHPAKLPPLYLAYDPGPGGDQRRSASEFAGVVQRRGQDRGGGDAEIPRPDGPGPGRPDVGGLGRVARDHEREFRFAADDHEHRAGESADDRGRAGVGASAKFAGSGGAIVGLYHSARQYLELVDALGEVRCSVVRPMIFES